MGNQQPNTKMRNSKLITGLNTTLKIRQLNTKFNESPLKFLQTSYQRNASFFLNSSNYISYLNEMKIREIETGIVTSIDLECTGHGSFYPNKVASRFLQNLDQLIDSNPQIKKIKIKLSGFDLLWQIIKGKTISTIQYSLVDELVRILSKRINTLKSLEIRICNVTNCKTSDFKALMRLGLNISAKKLTVFSCEFSNWSFAKSSTYKNQDPNDQYIRWLKEKDESINRSYQPNINEFLNMFSQSIQIGQNHSLKQLKKFRLQISTWYYTDYEIEKFFLNTQLMGIDNLPKQDKIPQRIQYFHNQLQKRFQHVIGKLMIGLTDLEVDLRNWNKKFQMGMLKSSLLNISSFKTNPLPQNLNESVDYDQDEEKRNYFDFIVVV